MVYTGRQAKDGTCSLLLIRIEPVNLCGLLKTMYYTLTANERMVKVWPAFMSFPVFYPSTLIRCSPSLVGNVL